MIVKVSSHVFLCSKLKIEKNVKNVVIDHNGVYHGIGECVVILNRKFYLIEKSIFCQKCASKTFEQWRGSDLLTSLPTFLKDF